jgi:hypothetical protein
MSDPTDQIYREFLLPHAKSLMLDEFRKLRERGVLSKD